MKNIIKFLLFIPIYLYSILAYVFFNKNTKLGLASFRYFFVLTNGRSNDIANKVISFFIPKYSIPNITEGVLGKIDQNKLDSIVLEIERNGYFVFDERLDEEVISRIISFAEKTPVSYLKFAEKSITYSTEKIIFDEKSDLSPRYQFNVEELMESKEIQSLVFDQSLLAVANSYLRTKPVLDIITMWWSLPFSEKAADRAAQKYHFDMDRFKFIKFFFYLTDVDENNGPHCYVKGSHKRIPKKLLFDRRIEDEEIKEVYSSEDVMEITGQKGSIIAVDTRGFHKGKLLSQGKRLLFQMQYSNSLFGAPYNTSIDNLKCTPEQEQIKKMFRRTYKLLK